MQPVGDPRRIVAERRFRAEIDGAVISAIYRHGGGSQNEIPRNVAAPAALCWGGAMSACAVIVRTVSPLRLAVEKGPDPPLGFLCRSAPRSPSSDSINSPVCGLASRDQRQRLQHGELGQRRIGRDAPANSIASASRRRAR